MNLLFLFSIISIVLSFERVLRIVDDLQSAYLFDNYVIFQIGKLPVERVDRVLKAISENSTVMTFKDEEAEQGLNKRVSKNSLIVVFAGSFRIAEQSADSNFNAASGALRGVRGLKAFFVIFSPLEDVREFCRWLWINKFGQALFAFWDSSGAFNIFTYDPFPQWTPFNLTGSRVGFREHQAHDVLGHVFDIYYLPYTECFLNSNQTADRDLFGGKFGMFFNNFLRYIHARVGKLVLTVKIEQELIDNGTVVISPVPHITLTQPSDLFEAIYPLTKFRNCALMPMRREIARNRYVTLPFDFSVHIAIVVSVVLAGFLLHGTYRRMAFLVDVGEAILHSLKLIVYLPSPIPQRLAMNRRTTLFVIYILILVLGFILNNFEMAFLSLYLTTRVKPKPISTFGQLAASSTKVQMLNGHEPINMTDLYAAYPHLFVRVNDTLGYIKEASNIDSKYVHFLSEHAIESVLQQQLKLSYPKRMKQDSMCIMPRFMTTTTDKDSYFAVPLHKFILAMYEGGLLQIWQYLAIKQGRDVGRFEYSNEEFTIIRPLDFDFFASAWIVLCFGYLAAIYSFAAECLCT